MTNTRQGASRILVRRQRTEHRAGLVAGHWIGRIAIGDTVEIPRIELGLYETLASTDGAGIPVRMLGGGSVVDGSDGFGGDRHLMNSTVSQSISFSGWPQGGTIVAFFAGVRSGGDAA